ncbi:MAG: helix-turn-helix domain-containing protein, partial [Thermoguttaceae bacterium]
MNSDYYSLEKVAEVLGLPTAEVNRLREKNSLRAFRDGASWKFRKIDVDNYLAETIKNRGKSDQSSESDFDLLGMDADEETPTLLADSVSFDSLMEDGLSLSGDIVNGPSKPGLDLSKPVDNDALVVADDDLMLVDDELSLADEPAVYASKSSSPTSSVQSSASKSSLSPSQKIADSPLDDDDFILDSSDSDLSIDFDEDSALLLLDDSDNTPVPSSSASNLKSASAKIEAPKSDQADLDADDDIFTLAEHDFHTPEDTSTVSIQIADDIEDEFQLDPGTG